MLENNNRKVCRRLVWREFKFHRLRNIFLVSAIALIAAMYTFTFLLGGSVKDAVLTVYENYFGSTSHIIYYGLTDEQADKLSGHAEVKSAARLKTVGLLSDELLGYGHITLAAAGEACEKTLLTMPTTGRMPQEGNEIALDAVTLDSFGIPHEIGIQVPLKWRSKDGTKEQTSMFTLCGFWSGLTGSSESYAWITEDHARQLLDSHGISDTANITLGITLHQPRDPGEKAGRITSELGLTDISFQVNPAYDSNYIKVANQDSVSYYNIIVFVLMCGVLMIYNIVHISVKHDIRFYGQLKTLGMTPRQIHYIIQMQAWVLSVMSIPVGWLLGVLIHRGVFPQLNVSMESYAALQYRSFWPFAVAALLTWITTWASCFLPARLLGKMSPAEAVDFVDGKEKGRRAVAHKRRRITVTGMAAASLKRDKGHTVLSSISLFLALLLLCGTWIVYISYDEDIYISALALCDYTILDGSIATSFQRYNPKSRSISPEMVKEIRERPGVLEVGTVKTSEEDMEANDILHDKLCSYYNGIGEQGIPRKDEQPTDSPWREGFDLFEQEKKYVGLVAGLDGPALDAVTNTDEVLDGRFDAEKFLSGGYVITEDYANEEGFYAMPAGEKVFIQGREFTVMMVIESTDVINGNNTLAAEFSLTYYLPLQVFQELYPDSAVRQIMVNIDPAYQEEFEEFLIPYVENAESGMALTMRSDYQQSFRRDRFTETIGNLMTGLVLMLTGILNFINTLVTKIIVRQREFAVYESLGMTRRQLRKLFLVQGVMHTVLLMAVLVPAVFAVTWYGMPWLVGGMTSWCVTYRYSLLPLWIAIPVLTALSILVPMVCFWLITKDSIINRLRTTE